jgi:hypothetical protein
MAVTRLDPVVDAAPADLAARSASAAALLAGRDVRRAAKLLSRVVIAEWPAWSKPENIVDSAVQVKAWPSNRAPEQRVPDTVHDIRTHMERAAAATSPAATDGRSVPPDLRAAIRHAAAFTTAAEAWRDRQARVRAVEKASRALDGTRAKLDAITPEHIRRMPNRPDPALYAASLLAVGAPDDGFALACAVGFQAVGDIPASGWWPEREPSAEPLDIASLDNDAWHDFLEARMSARAAADPAERARMAEVYAKTLEECAAGLMNGPFTREQLDAAHGKGNYRGMERFGILQHGRLRGCDNAKTSRHNASTRLREKMLMSTAEFPARAAGEFRRVSGRPRPMRGGTEDIGSFYRVVPCSEPQWTVVLVMTPEGVRYFTMPSFNFGLASAPNQCCRVSEAALRIIRGIGGVSADKFVDDFAVVETDVAQASGQWAAAEIARLLRTPFAARKHVPGDSAMIYLGVCSDFGDGPCEVVELSVSERRLSGLATLIADTCAAGSMPSALAATFAGKLIFTLTWMAGRVGRAALQPLFAATECTGHDDAILPSARRALEFFEEILPLLPPRRFATAPSDERPVLVWTDGASEPGASREHTVGFVVAIPRDDAPPGGVPVSADEFARVYRCVHGSAELPPAYMRRFLLPHRKQQIGQVELVAAFTPYASVDASVWRDRRVLHWIDNSSAVAALVKGYSSAIDSALIVQAVHATLAGLGADVWFEYVRTNANVSDEPSRVDLSYERYAIGADVAAGVQAFVTSEPVPTTRLPEPSEWDAGAAAWMRRARDRG